MTIIASVKVRDGIVLATDSMTQISARLETGEVKIIKAYSNARKLFQIRDLPIGTMSHGLGNIGPRSIENLVLEFSRRLDKLVEQPWTVEKVARGLYSFIKGVYDETFQGLTNEKRKRELTLGFFISGYSPNAAFAQEWEFLLPAATDVKRVRQDKAFGSSWRGITLPFERLYNGFDRRIADALKKADVPDEVIKQTLNIERLRMPIAYDGMPVQDAINFAVYILETTIGSATFEVGLAPTCGGPLQIATISPDTGWRWICQPELAISSKE
jgi:hypothetical protein